MKKRKSYIKRIRTVRILFFMAISMIALEGCKTNVANYRSAYDIAKEKRQREDSLLRSVRDEMGMNKETTLEDPDGFRIIKVDERDVWVRNANFSREDSIAVYAAAVASFKMPANAASMSDELRGEGFPLTKVGKQGDLYIVVIGSDVTPEHPLNLLDSYIQKYPNVVTIGQPAPGLIIGGSR